MNPGEYAAYLRQRVERGARRLFRECVRSTSIPRQQSSAKLTVNLEFDAVTFRKRLKLATRVMNDSTMDPFVRAKIAAEILEASVR